MAGVQSTTLRLVVHDSLGGANQWTWIDRTITIVNGNPVFTTATYKDANSTTTAITGNDQYLIQGYSTLEVDILSANKAVAQKQATMTKYNLAIGSINTDVTYTTSDIAQNLGTLGINADATLNVKAIDSRNNSTTVPLTVHVLPYVVPQVTATVQRVNNFETSTDFHIEGVISRLTIGGTDKNTVNTSTGVRYRYKKTTDASWGSWVNKTSSTSAGNVSVTDFNVPSALDRNYAWNIQIEITDKLNTSTLDLVLPVGIPIFRIGLDGNVYNNEVRMLTTDDLLASNPYKFSAYKSANSSYNDGSTNDVVFNSESYDTNNNFNTTTGRYTVPVTGYYWIGASVRIGTNNAGSGGSRWLWDAMATLRNHTDGVDLDQAKSYVYADGRMTIFDGKMGRLHYLVAGKEIKVTAFSDTNDGSQWVMNGGIICTSISGFLVAKV
jgi:hypothetical protein